MTPGRIRFRWFADRDSFFSGSREDVPRGIVTNFWYEAGWMCGRGSPGALRIPGGRLVISDESDSDFPIGDLSFPEDHPEDIRPRAPTGAPREADAGGCSPLGPNIS